MTRTDADVVILGGGAAGLAAAGALRDAGAYSFPIVGGSGAAKVLARPIQGTLFFAGGAVDSEMRSGTVHGASGRRAAGAALRALG